MTDTNQSHISASGLPLVRVSATVDPYLKAFVKLSEGVNGSGIFRTALAERIDQRDDIDKEEIIEALKTLSEDGIDPNQAINDSDSIDDLIQKIRIHHQ